MYSSISSSTTRPATSAHSTTLPYAMGHRRSLRAIGICLCDSLPATGRLRQNIRLPLRLISMSSPPVAFIPFLHRQKNISRMYSLSVKRKATGVHNWSTCLQCWMRHIYRTFSISYHRTGTAACFIDIVQLGAATCHIARCRSISARAVPSWS